MKNYITEIEKTETGIRDLLLELKINIKFDRFICFSSLFLYTQKKPFKLIASESFEDEEGKNRKTIKVQIMHLDKKLSKMSIEDIQLRLSKLLQLYSLFKKFHSLLDMFQAEIDLEYSDYVINFQLTGEYNDYDELVNRNTARYKKYKESKKTLHTIKKNIEQYKYKKIKYYTQTGEYLK
ncbi:hypothetical protein [Poseidonibacter ostreae]|uniref:Uncharacterized protein n=1 Tax=Poseidonibacter ostreae TaxID=2654171 RepID=A0A6L4WTV4_9BACT|nr:hypothetical protein [Poseidonibacter ostreae]KAB7889580.1 hypothetical protein GBG19_05855 [Poseidonibacter ostreae]